MWKAKCEEQQKHIDCTMEQVSDYTIPTMQGTERNTRKLDSMNRSKQSKSSQRGQIEPCTAALQKVSTERSLTYYYKRKCEKLAGTECNSCNFQQEEENRELKDRLLEL